MEVAGALWNFVFFFSLILLLLRFLLSSSLLFISPSFPSLPFVHRVSGLERSVLVSFLLPVDSSFFSPCKYLGLFPFPLLPPTLGPEWELQRVTTLGIFCLFWLDLRLEFSKGPAGSG